MLRRIRLLCGWSGPAFSYGPGHELAVPGEVDRTTAERLVADGAAMPVAVERAEPEQAPPAPPVETATIEPPERAVAAPQRRKGNRR